MDFNEQIKILQSRHEIILWDEFETEFFSSTIGAKFRRDGQQKVRPMKGMNRFVQKELKVKNPKSGKGRAIIEPDQGL